MGRDVDLPARASGESHGAYYRRCALLWLPEHGDSDPEHRAQVLRLGALAGAPERPRG